MPEDNQADGSQLTTWIKTHLGSLYLDQGESDDDDNFNSTFSENVSIYLNHERIPRDDFKSKIKSSLSALSLPSTIDWKEVLEIPTKSEEEGAVASVPIGIVAGFFVVTRTMKFKIRASNAQTLSYNSFSARLCQEGGQTRIAELFLTFCNRPAPIHLRGIPSGLSPTGPSATPNPVPFSSITASSGSSAGTSVADGSGVTGGSS